MKQKTFSKRYNQEKILIAAPPSQQTAQATEAASFWGLFSSSAFPRDLSMGRINSNKTQIGYLCFLIPNADPQRLR